MQRPTKNPQKSSTSGSFTEDIAKIEKDFSAKMSGLETELNSLGSQCLEI